MELWLRNLSEWLNKAYQDKLSSLKQVIKTGMTMIKTLPVGSTKIVLEWLKMIPMRIGR